jgi:hypothetical protein
MQLLGGHRAAATLELNAPKTRFLADRNREETRVMIVKTMSLAFAAVCFMAVSGMPAAHAQPAQVVTNGPQVDQGDTSPNWSARQNVIESDRYDRLLERNGAFRQARERKECGPITDPQLHQQCLDSFAQYEPSGGTATGSSSSGPNGEYRSGAGR